MPIPMHLGRASHAFLHLSLPIAKLCGNLPNRQYGKVQSSFTTHGGFVGIESLLASMRKPCLICFG